jgi:hypothetical protein
MPTEAVKKATSTAVVLSMARVFMKRMGEEVWGKPIDGQNSSQASEESA